ncbi:MAG: hypothetical protein KBA31_15305 [Alphaproteobacteria bacterium]|nr:hypothetical protein [Alphaproteobacteria bacterium]
MRTLQNSAWPSVLAASTIAGSLAIACMMPFVALAVVVAASMPARQAVFTVTAIVAANQAIGFAFLGFPADGYTIAWGAALWGASLASLATARLIVGPSPDLSATRIALASLAAFAAYEALLYAFATQVGGIETFTPAIIMQLAQNEALWLLTLVTLRLLVTGAAPAIFGAQPRLRLA